MSALDDLSEYEKVEASYIAKDHKKIADDVLVAKVYDTYKGAVFPMIYATEKGEDGKLLGGAYKELHKDVKAPAMYFITQAMCNMFPEDGEPCTVSGPLAEKIKSFIYASLKGGENLSTVYWAPKEVLETVFGGELTTQEYQRFCVNFITSGNVMEDSHDAYVSTSTESQKVLTVAYKNNSLSQERRGKRIAVVKTGARIGVRGALIAIMHTYGGIVCAVAAGMAGCSVFFGVTMLITKHWVVLLLFLTNIVCCGIFIWQTLIKSGSNLKQLFASFYIGVPSFIIGVISMEIVGFLSLMGGK